MKKKLKIVGLEKALENIPVEDREALGQEIRSLFQNAEPGKLPPGAKLVRHLEPGTKTCPECGKKLGKPHTTQLPKAVGGGLMTFVDCEACDQPYEMKATE
jgi:hypothetical protein